MTNEIAALENEIAELNQALASAQRDADNAAGALNRITAHTRIAAARSALASQTAKLAALRQKHADALEKARIARHENAIKQAAAVYGAAKAKRTAALMELEAAIKEKAGIVRAYSAALREAYNAAQQHGAALAGDGGDVPETIRRIVPQSPVSGFLGSNWHSLDGLEKALRFAPAAARPADLEPLEPL